MGKKKKKNDRWMQAWMEYFPGMEEEEKRRQRRYQKHRDKHKGKK